MKHILRYDDFLIINENLQKAEKELFKPGLLNDEEKNRILKITNRDNYTYIVSLIYHYLKLENRTQYLNKYYDMVKSYHKNVFPIENYEKYNIDNIGYIVAGLELRDKCIQKINELPSIAKRNLKDFISTTRNNNSFRDALHKLEYLSDIIYMISNKPESSRNKLYQKIFKSNSDIDDMIDFLEDKSNLIEENYFTKEKIDEILSDDGDDDISWCVTKIYDMNNRYVLRIDDIEGLLKLGTNSLWCFTYGKSHRQFDEYSYDGIVYLLIDFNMKPSDNEYMCVVINPDFENEAAIFDQTNETLYDEDEEYNYQIPYLERFFGKNIDDISLILDFE